MIDTLKFLSDGRLDTFKKIKENHKNKILGKYLAQQLKCNESDLKYLEKLRFIKKIESWHGLTAYKII